MTPQPVGFSPNSKPLNFQNRQLPELDYLTREFVRGECGVFGATLDDRECDLIILETQQLYLQGQFHHTGVYWVANALAANNLIHLITVSYTE